MCPMYTAAATSSVRKKLFILIPAPTPDGPIKGAYALANALIEHQPVTIVSLKDGPGASAPLDSRVRQISLSAQSSLLKRLLAYRHLLREEGGRTSCQSLSMCFSADFVNVFCRSMATTTASIRGNLMENYRHDYGWKGLLLALLHLFLTRRFDQCIAMTAAMARQISSVGAGAPAVIGNFVDEQHLASYRHKQGQLKGALRFVFVGSMTTRKQPRLLVQAFAELIHQGVDAHLDMIGSGPMLAPVKELATAKGLANRITFHGQVREPYPVIAAADAMVLPSLSEGLSRAVLEALYLGTPCVLRQVDGNLELIQRGCNGVLIGTDKELAHAMLEAASLGRRLGKTTCLLPEAYRQQTCVTKYLNVMENIVG